MIKRTLIGILEVMFCLCIHAQEKDLLTLDGDYWNSSNESDKFCFLQGFALGANLGWRLFPLSHYTIERELRQTDLIDQAFVITKAFMEKLFGITLLRIAIGQLKDGVDTFYKDASNHRIKVVDAIFVAKLQMQEKNPQLIEAQLRYLKMQPIAHKISARAIDKLMTLMKENVRTGKIGVTLEDLKDKGISLDDILPAGIFFDENNKEHRLFSYGKYE